MFPSNIQAVQAENNQKVISFTIENNSKENKQINLFDESYQEVVITCNGMNLPEFKDLLRMYPERLFVFQTRINFPDKANLATPMLFGKKDIDGSGIMVPVVPFTHLHATQFQSNIIDIPSVYELNTLLKVEIDVAAESSASITFFVTADKEFAHEITAKNLKRGGVIGAFESTHCLRIVNTSEEKVEWTLYDDWDSMPNGIEVYRLAYDDEYGCFIWERVDSKDKLEACKQDYIAGRLSSFRLYTPNEGACAARFSVEYPESYPEAAKEASKEGEPKEEQQLPMKQEDINLFWYDLSTKIQPNFIDFDIPEVVFEHMPYSKSNLILTLEPNEEAYLCAASKV